MPQSATFLSTDGKQSGDAVGSSTGSVLIPRTLYGTLMRAVRKNLIFRSLAAHVFGPTSIPGSSIDIPLQTPESMVVHPVGEFGIVPLDIEGYTNINLRPRKYGVRLMISKEMMEDSLFDVMALNVETAGYELADNEESLIIDTLDTATAQTDSTRIANSNATLPITDITAAMQGLEEEGYVATHFICGVEVANDLRNIDTFVEAHKSGINDPSRRLIGKIYEMKVLTSRNVTAKRAYVIDANYSFVIADKRPVTIERYFEAARDTGFAVATQRFSTRYLRSAATARIVTT